MRIFILLLTIFIFGCNKAKIKPEAGIITSKEDQEKYLNGDWNINGILQGGKKFIFNLEGDIRFQPNKKFTTSILLTDFFIEKNQKLYTMNTKGNGSWKWEENGGIGFAYDSASSCECKITSFDKRFPETTLLEYSPCLN